MIEKHPLEKLCFVLQKYKSTYSVHPEQWHYVLRWIDCPHQDAVKMLKSDDWHFTLRPAFESGWVTNEHVKTLEACRLDEDLPQLLVKLSLLGVDPKIMFEEENEHLTKIEDLTSGEILFTFRAEKAEHELEA